MAGALTRVSVQTAMQYRSDFLFEALTGFLRTGATLGALLLVYVHREQVAGWTLPEALLVMALFLLLSGVVQAVLEPNLGAAVEHIRTGTLDLLLMKPADAQLLVSVSRVAPARLWDALAGVALVAWCLPRLPTQPGLADATVAAALFALGLAAIYGLWILAICTSFHFVRVDNLRFLLVSVSDAGRWPLGVFAGWIQVVLVWVIPVGVVTTFPALALRGQWDARLVGAAALAAALFVFGSRVAWRRSLGAYTSASS